MMAEGWVGWRGSTKIYPSGVPPRYTFPWAVGEVAAYRAISFADEPGMTLKDPLLESPPILDCDSWFLLSCPLVCGVPFASAPVGVEYVRLCFPANTFSVAPLGAFKRAVAGAF